MRLFILLNKNFQTNFETETLALFAVIRDKQVIVKQVRFPLFICLAQYDRDRVTLLYFTGSNECESSLKLKTF